MSSGLISICSGSYHWHSQPLAQPSTRMTRAGHAFIQTENSLQRFISRRKKNHSTLRKITNPQTVPGQKPPNCPKNSDFLGPFCQSLRIYRGGAVHPIHGDEARFWHGGPGRWMFEETQPSTAVLALSRLGSKTWRWSDEVDFFLLNQLEKKWEHKMYQQKDEVTINVDQG